MKKYLVAIALSVACISADAQTDKGSFLVGGSLNLSRSQRSYDTPPNPASVANSPYASFSVSPTVGFFAVSKFMIGAQISYNYTWTLDSYPGKQNTLSGGPVLRYYFPIGKFAVFPEVAALFGTTTSNYYNFYGNGTFSEGKASRKVSTYRAGLGVAWFVTNTIGIEGILAYKDTEYTKMSIDRVKNLYLNFGIQFYLPRK